MMLREAQALWRVHMAIALAELPAKSRHQLLVIPDWVLQMSEEAILIVDLLSQPSQLMPHGSQTNHSVDSFLDF